MSGSLPIQWSWLRPVLKLRETYPRWGKDKLVVLLHREGFDCSASVVGRILHKLKERGVLREPVSNPPIGKEKAVAATLCCKEAQRIPG